mgnify:CR=1 FL=1
MPLKAKESPLEMMIKGGALSIWEKLGIYGIRIPFPHFLMNNLPDEAVA